MNRLLHGLVAATHTPLTPDGRVAIERIPGLVDFVLAGGAVDGLFVLGSTGEGPSLTVDERRRVAEAFVAAARGRVPVAIHVGHQSLDEARGLATHAAAIGADAISAVLGGYFPIQDLDTAARAVATIAAGAPDTPFYYYEIPALSRLALDTPQLLDRLLALVPTLQGIKYTSPALPAFQACVAAYGDRLDCLYGCDEMLLGGLGVGAHGAVGSTYNFAAPLYRALLDAFAAGDLAAARRCQAASVAMVRSLIAHGGGPAIKTAMALCGYDCGPVRLPQRAPDAASTAVLRAELEACGLFRWRAGDVRV